MRATLSSYALVGIEAVTVDVVVDADRAKVVEPETRRILHSVRLDMPLSERPIIVHVVNVRTSPLRKRAPADLKKDANGFDLPIALGLLVGSGQVSFDRPGNYAIVGELALTGETRPVKGILSMGLQAVLEGRDGLLVPRASASEAAVVEGLNVYPVGSLAEAVGFLDVLPQPLEEGKVTISRAMNSSTFPADFILVAAVNPCPCG